MPSAPHSLLPHEHPQSLGNRALLVLVDRRGGYTDTDVVSETTLVPLRHLGFPYRLFDLADGRLTAEQLDSCAGVIVAQAHLTAALSPPEAELLAAAVIERGLGLVNFDGGDLPRYPAALLSLMNLEVDRLPVASDRLLITHNDHFINWTLPPGGSVRLKRPITVSQIRSYGRGTVEIAQAVVGKDQLIFARHHIPGTAYEPGQLPAVLAAVCGQGRVVQFAFSPRLWHADFLGHGLGLDALFWRAIAWSVRKPFVATMMPPYVTLRVDDAIGRHDFRYADVLSQRDYHPLISCFIEQVPADLAPMMRAHWEAGQADWDAHALSYYRLIPFDFGVGEYDESQLAANFDQVDRWYAAGGFRPPRTAYFHWGEIGLRALPHLKARGRNYVYCPYQLGQLKWERQPPHWWPYGLNSLFYDYHPDDPELYNLGGSLPRNLMEPDVLTGCTVWGGDNPTNDMTKAAQRAATAIRLALDSGFFAEVTTHEQKLGVLQLGDIDSWLARLEGEVARYPLRLVGHEQAADYTKARDETWITASNSVDSQMLTLELAGHTNVPLELAVFENDGQTVRERWCPVPAFDQTCQVTL